jgi:hypothetical protein
MKGHNNSRIDVEIEFTQFIRNFGGQVIEDKHGTTLPFKNADYYFENEGIVAELKRLELNQEEDPNTQDKIQAKFNEWIESGVIGPVYGTVKINSKILPERCQIELLDLFASPLRKRIQKANKQIKETIEHFNPKDPKGLLFLVNDGNYTFEADIARHLIKRTLGNEFKSINSVVYLTVNMTATSSLTENDSLVWIHFNRRNIIEPVDTDFVMNLFYKWKHHLEVLRGESIETVVADRQSLESIKFRSQT